MENKYKIIVIGVGGTGGVFAKEFVQFVSTLSRARQSRISEIVLVDGDLVERKNLVRQPFIEEEIGLNKALVMAELLTNSYGVTVCAYPHYIVSVEGLSELLQGSATPVIIGCADNHHVRNIMDEYFHNENVRECLYIDSANEYSVGEVVTAIKAEGIEFAPTRPYYFPGIYEDEELVSVEELSCEELNQVAPQHKVVNMYAALIILTVMCRFLQEDRIDGGITYFDAFKNYSRFDKYSVK